MKDMNKKIPKFDASGFLIIMSTVRIELFFVYPTLLTHVTVL